jgi:hypothetical protein
MTERKHVHMTGSMIVRWYIYVLLLLPLGWIQKFGSQQLNSKIQNLCVGTKCVLHILGYLCGNTLPNTCSNEIQVHVLTSLCKTVVVGEYMLLLDGEHAWKLAGSSSFLMRGVGVIPVPSVDIIDTCNRKLLLSQYSRWIIKPFNFKTDTPHLETLSYSAFNVSFI